jgi:hypothetical protein
MRAIAPTDQRSWGVTRMRPFPKAAVLPAARPVKIHHLEVAVHVPGVSRWACAGAGHRRLSELKIVCRFDDRGFTGSPA